MKTRREQYAEFMWCLAKLFMYARARDIIIKGMEWWRTWEKAAEYAAKGVGVKNSKHCYSLAIDIYIVNNTGKDWLRGKDPKEYALYQILGDYWEKGLGQTWGPTIRKGDVYHFEYRDKPA